MRGWGGGRGEGRGGDGGGLVKLYKYNVLEPLPESQVTYTMTYTLIKMVAPGSQYIRWVYIGGSYIWGWGGGKGGMQPDRWAYIWGVYSRGFVM